MRVISSKSLQAYLQSRSADVECLDEYDPATHDASVPLLSRVWPQIYAVWRAGAGGVAPQCVRSAHTSFWTQDWIYVQLLSSTRSTILVVGEDGPSAELWLIAAARHLGLPVFVIPYEASGRDEYVNNVLKRVADDAAIRLTDRGIDLLRKLDESHWVLMTDSGPSAIHPAE